MEIGTPRRDSGAHESFKIDLIVWKFRKPNNNNKIRSKFKIDLIVWKLDT